jgi:uncharacterized membrane protein AbrB (regulator of aidB expression)
MRPWIRKHRLAALFWAVMALAGIGGILIFCYFTYWFTLPLASAPGGMDSNCHEAIAVIQTCQRS